MKTTDEQIEALEHTILSFEKHIQDTKVTKGTLEKAQDHLDDFEKKHPASAGSTDPRLLARMYEFQVLIDYAQGSLKRAQAFIAEAYNADPDNQFVSETVAHLAGMDGGAQRQNSGGQVPFFVVSAWRFIALGVLSVGLYIPYWFYKNWQAVQEATGRKQLPFLSAIFCRFVSYNLFVDIKNAAEANGYDRPFSPGWRAFVFFLFGPLALIGINYPMEAGGGQRPNQLQTGEVILLILGLLYWGLVIISSATAPSYDDSPYTSGYDQPLDSYYSNY